MSHPSPDIAAGTAGRTTARIVGLDVARALALVGMVIVNFKVVMDAEDRDPGGLGETVALLDGRAAATFVVLAGIGASLLSARARASGDPALVHDARVLLLKRAAFLLVLGYGFLLIWPADILHYYGLYLAVGALLLTATSRQLVAVMAGVVAVSFAWIVSVDYFARWDLTGDLDYEGLWQPDGLVRNLLFDGFHPVFPWVGFYLFGLWLGRQDLRSARFRWRTIAICVVIAVVAEVLAAVIVGKGPEIESLDDDDWRLLFLAYPLPPLPLYVAAAGATATAAILLCVSLGERLGRSRLLFPLVATGQLALTLYVAHVVIGMGILDELGRLEDQTMTFAVASALAFSAAAILFSTLWRKRFRRGPVEAVMRRLTG